jgi:formylglycine-generating enzyme required for sulfatase activity
MIVSVVSVLGGIATFSAALFAMMAVRGGCWADDGWPCRSAFRLRFEPERRYGHIGFRVVAVPV